MQVSRQTGGGNGPRQPTPEAEVRGWC